MTSKLTPRLSARHGRGDSVRVRRLPIRFAPDDGDVVTLPFFYGGHERLRRLHDRVAALGERAVVDLLRQVYRGYDDRHHDLPGTFREHARGAAALIERGIESWPAPRVELLGSYLTMEYSISAAALFNPSIVPHPDQSGLDDGRLRFIISLRATGEGHISSIVFRTGVLGGEQQIVLDAARDRLVRVRVRPDRAYVKPLIVRRLREINAMAPASQFVLDQLPDSFTLAQLLHVNIETRAQTGRMTGGHGAVDMLLWLVNSNHCIKLDDHADLTQLVIFPSLEHDSRGLEDLRLVRVREDDGGVNYYGTYTAFNGVRTLPMLLQTGDFRTIEFHSLNGRAALNKGMALFPRRVGGHYVMCSRIDGENLFIAYSDFIHFWESAELLAQPREPWEMRQLGNCGSPIETPEGWLLLTHGVGPMRGYCIGAMLLDLDDPCRVRGRLRNPLLSPLEGERSGYVPNVVYTCGALVHRGRLFMPYARSDTSASMAVIDLHELLDRLIQSGP